ncbi:Alpha/Beta hydrolase protein [Lipomyces oligophaga]|uniref:Alpha/Beta hydrolase protein n=1 Tax=Lipomyces oligophaga TaxID=45792 RepID=UPI0034CEBC91
MSEIVSEPVTESTDNAPAEKVEQSVHAEVPVSETTQPVAEAPAATSGEVPTETPSEVTAEVTAEVFTEVPTEVPAEVPVEVSSPATEVPVQEKIIVDKPSMPSFLSKFKFQATMAFESAMHTALMRNSSKGWDLQTHLMVSAVRYYMNRSGRTIEELQEATQRASLATAKGVCNQPCTIAEPDEATAACLAGMINAARDKLGADAGFADASIPDATITCVAGEWVAKESSVTAGEPVSVGPDENVILFAHGGSYTFCSSADHRYLTSELAANTGAKVLSIDYRLAPQHPVPSAIADFLTAYHYLLHTCKIPCSRIFFAGDSAGGGIFLAVLSILLCNKNADMPVPMGAIAFAPFVDMTRCLPTERSRAMDKYDYIPNANHYPQYKKSAVWPVENKRYFPYAEDNAIAHPLVSPMTNPCWTGSCPLLLFVGEERFRDAVLLFSKLYQDAGNPTWTYYHETMPHVFQFIGAHHASVEKSYETVKCFVETVCKPGEDKLESKRVDVTVRGEELQLWEKLIPALSYEEIKDKMVQRTTELKYLLRYVVADLYPADKKKAKK